MDEVQERKFVIKELTKPFFKKYYYSAKINNPAYLLYPTEQWDGDNNSLGDWNKRIQAKYRRYLKKTYDFLEPIIGATQAIDLHFREGRAVHNFYFENENSYNDFIALVGDNVCEVTFSSRPRESFQTEHDIILCARDTKYLDRYDYKITFCADSDGEEINSWVDSVFFSDVERYYFREDNIKKVLYLSCEADVVMTKLAYMNDIELFEQVI